MTFSPRTWVVGEIVTAAMLNAEIRDQIMSMLDAWTPYTPVFGSSGTAPAVGNGVITGRYMKIGRTVQFAVQMVVGTTTTYGSGNLNVSLPVGAATVAGGSPGVIEAAISRSTTPNFAVGRAPIPNGSATTGTIWMPSVVNAGDWDAWTFNTPWTIANGDVVRVYGTYQAAT